MQIKRQFAAFSDAIRFGSKLRPQAFDSGTADASCALQAGYEAITGKLAFGGEYFGARSVFTYLQTASAQCPACLSGVSELIPLEDVCWHLNDVHKYTREAVADWLQEQEDRLAGFETVLETQPSCESRDNNATPPQSGVSLPESSLGVSCLKN